MLLEANPIVLTTRDAVAQLLNDTKHRENTTETGHTGHIGVSGGALGWPVRLALAAAFNHLDDALPTLAPPLPPPDEPPEHADVAARVQTLRTDLLRLLEDLPDDVDCYAVGYAAGELGTALRELTTGRPA